MILHDLLSMELNKALEEVLESKKPENSEFIVKIGPKSEFWLEFALVCENSV